MMKMGTKSEDKWNQALGRCQKNPISYGPVCKRGGGGGKPTGRNQNRCFFLKKNDAES